MVKFTLMAVSALVLATSTSAVAAQKSNKEACKDLKQLRSSVSKLQQLGPESTVGELEQQEEKVVEALQTFAQASQQYAPKETDNLRSAIRQLKSAHEGMPSNATLGQAQAIIDRDRQEVRDAAQELGTKLNCPAPASR